jgi:type II secretory pathway pseudopilin PulG
MSQRGHTLVEMLLVIGILVALAAVGPPMLKAYSDEAQLVGAAAVFQGEFRKARSIAVRRGIQTAIRFEQLADGMYYSVYEDGNYNGVLSVEILRGTDRRVSGPRRLDASAPGVRVGINPGLPAPPPDSGPLDTADPIRFGRSEMLSFSPMGTATPGTFYLAGSVLQAAVRVNGNSARVRTMICRGGVWREK